VTAAPLASGTLWRPRSGCGPACLPPAAGPAAVPAPVRLLRLAGVLLVVLGAAALLPVLRLAGPARRRRALRRFCRAVLRALGVRVRVRGPAHRGRALLVANHVSWMDSLVLLATAGLPDPIAGSGATPGLCLVAKSEVAGWPVVGRFAVLAGTVFVDRARPRLLPGTVAQVREALRAGDRVAVFPEGTTSCGRVTGAFRPAMFQAAVEAGAPVLPVGLRYRLAGGEPTAAAAFVGEESLLRCVLRIIATPGLRVEVGVRTAIHPEAATARRTPVRARAARRLLAHAAQAAIGPEPAAEPAPAQALDQAPAAAATRRRWPAGQPSRTASPSSTTASVRRLLEAVTPGPENAWDRPRTSR
jgi:1-acyl-sn-glycerol-3-phosphate acyltransferase